MIKQIILAKNIGFCFGVEKAIELAESIASNDVTILGELVHNRLALDKLAHKGIKTVDNVDDVTTSKCVIRTHGEGKETYQKLKDKGIEVFDATCPFVKKIHKIVEKHYNEGFRIVIAGHKEHSEVKGILGWCNNDAIVIGDVEDIPYIYDKKICVVSQTTFSINKFDKIKKYFNDINDKLVVVFDTICYTTNERQTEAESLSKQCDVMLVIGDRKSSNTNKLYNICTQNCKQVYFIETLQNLNYIIDKLDGNIGLVAGASTPKELILEVYQTMVDNNKEQSFEQLLEEETVVKYVKGTKIKGAEIISADEKGIRVIIGGKNDGLVSPEEAVFDKEYNPADFKVGDKIDVEILGNKDKDSGCIPLSIRTLEAKKHEDKVVDGIRNNEEFSITVSAVDKGLIGKYGSYRVFVPQSHIQEYFVKDLNQYNKKTLRLRALEIDDSKKKIIASQKVILAEERKAREDAFFSTIKPDNVVKGKVLRATPFGAFVDVGGFDCLCHITDISWNKIAKVEDVLTIGQEYEFLVLSVDEAKKRVSLGYKQLHKHPFQEVAEKYPVGSTVTGKVVRLADFGAFIEIESNVTGLVHISEAAHDYVKSITDVLKVGQEVTAKVTKIDIPERKISLSIKAALPPKEVTEEEKEAKKEFKKEKSEAAESKKAPKVAKEKTAQAAEKKEQPRKRKPAKREDEPETATEWNEVISNNPMAELLKELAVKEQ